MTRGLLAMAGVMAALYLGSVAVLFFAQRALIYPAPKAAVPPPPGFMAVSYRTADGLGLKAAYRAARAGRPTVVFFHGNGDSWTGAGAATARLSAAGYGVVLPEYRGYGGNPGSPDEAGFYEDGRAALGWLARQGITRDRLVIVGNSIGSGVAVQMAKEAKPAALILVSPFASLPTVASEQLPWMPARWLVRDIFDNLAKIPDVAAPILVLHGEADRVIRFSHARRLAQASPRVRLVSFPAAGHELGYLGVAGEAQVRWLDDLFGRAP
jgi:fermentation-respiration switch protein FrsA (DUF1100 family)